MNETKLRNKIQRSVEYDSRRILFAEDAKKEKCVYLWLMEGL